MHGAARYCLDQGYHAVIDGVLYADRSEHMLAGLRHDHRGRSHFYYLDASMDETNRHHATRPPKAAEFGPDDMRDWYRPRDLLSSITERVIPETSTLQETIDSILGESQLPSNPAPAAHAADHDWPGCWQADSTRVGQETDGHRIADPS